MMDFSLNHSLDLQFPSKASLFATPPEFTQHKNLNTKTLRLNIEGKLPTKEIFFFILLKSRKLSTTIAHKKEKFFCIEILERKKEMLHKHF